MIYSVIINFNVYPASTILSKFAISQSRYSQHKKHSVCIRLQQDVSYVLSNDCDDIFHNVYLNLDFKTPKCPSTIIRVQLPLWALLYVLPQSVEHSLWLQCIPRTSEEPPYLLILEEVVQLALAKNKTVMD